MHWIAAEDELLHRPGRVLVAGTSGSGKSTLARGIARVLGVDYFEIDALYHGPGWTPDPQFVNAVTARIGKPEWVTEWQYSLVRDALADRADLLVWLDLPRRVVMGSVIRRTVRRSVLGVELWNGNREPPLRTIVSDPDHVVRWAWWTHHETAAHVQACVAQRPALSAVALRSRAQAMSWVAGPLTRSAHQHRYGAPVEALEVRRAVAGDADAAADLWLASRRTAHGLIPPPAHSEEDVRAWIASHVLLQLECWVAETVDGTIVGLLALDKDWVDQLYVLPGSQRQGVGGELLGLAKRLRPDGLQLWTFASNAPARRFYQQRGFHEIEQTDGAQNEEHAPDVRYIWQSLALSPEFRS